jgi:RNA-directed DNA polymerase
VNAAQLNDAVNRESTANSSWDRINWDLAEKTVNRIQVRIVKAVESGEHNLVKRLQYLLTHSFYAKASAVRRVTSSHGAKTPGVDGIIWKSKQDKFKAVQELSEIGYSPLALRRVYIDKPGKQEKRPLSIPAMRDRAMQALHLQALSPIAETLADRTSFGFREYRSTADAMKYVHLMLSRKTAAPWVVEGDIKGCFDNINHTWLTDHIPMNPIILGKFLKASFSYQKRLYPTTQGSAQGGVISPTLANMTLDGLQEELASKLKGCQHYYVRYADDFIVIVRDESTARQVIEIVNAFLEIRGLRLSETKTKITHISDGFDFLGWNFRKYRNGKLIIKPSSKSIKKFKDGIRDIFHKMKTAKQEDLIKVINPRITGWSNYHMSVNAKQTYNKVDNYIHWKLWKWAKRRHPKETKDWIRQRYWKSIGDRHCEFAADNLFLKRCSDTPIVRHSLVKLDANPYTNGDYFENKAQWRKERKCAAYSQTTAAQLQKLRYECLSVVR